MSVHGSYDDIEDWEEGPPECGLPAANPFRLGKAPPNLERERMDFANRFAAFVQGNPDLLKDEIVRLKKHRGRKRGTKVRKRVPP